MKRVIDEGFTTTLAQGLRIEAEAQKAYAHQVTPEAIAARRAAVQQRGREQAS
jgi:enoyl-CoA hydratase